MPGPGQRGSLHIYSSIFTLPLKMDGWKTSLFGMAYFQGVWGYVSFREGMFRKVTTHTRSTGHHPFANYERIPLYQPIGKGCSGYVPKVCWNDLRFLGDLFQGLWWTCWKKKSQVSTPWWAHPTAGYTSFGADRNAQFTTLDQPWSVVILLVWWDLMRCCILFHVFLFDLFWVYGFRRHFFVLSECPTPLWDSIIKVHKKTWSCRPTGSSWNDGNSMIFVAF